MAKKNTFDGKWLANRILQRPRPPAGSYDGVDLTVEIVPAGQPHCVISMRNAIFCGESPVNIAFDEDVEIRSLRYEGGEWMTDTPQEVWQMRGALERIRKLDGPELLVGGLGLGVFSHLAAEYAGAIVTTVERDERIIKAVAPWSTRNVVHDDIYKFADEVKAGEYRIAFMDTWQSTGEHCWVTEVVPLRRKLAKTIPEVLCWQEMEMSGQIRNSGLHAMCYQDSKMPASNVHWRVLRQTAEKMGVAYDLKQSASHLEQLQQTIEEAARLASSAVATGILERFLLTPGSSVWEEEFGQAWDTYYAQYLGRKNELSD